MKFLFCLLLGAVLAAAAVPASALGPVDVEAEVGVFSHYVWRGLVITDDPVLQPAATLGLLGFGVGVWGNVDLTDINIDEDDPNGIRKKLNEIDYTLTYGLNLPLLDLGVGLIHYTFPNSGTDATTEIFASGTAGVILSPTVGVFYDLDAVNSTYVSLGVGHGLELSPATTLNLGVSVGYGFENYAAEYYGPEILDKMQAAAKDVAGIDVGSGMTDFSIRASLPLSPAPTVTILPSVTYSSLAGDAKDVADADDALKSDALILGVSLSIAF